MATEPTTPKRTRKPRRNYEKELRELTLYCEVSVLVLGKLNSPDAMIKVDAYKDVLARLEAK